MSIEYIKLSAIIVATISFIMSIFHLILVFGVPLGEYAWGGKLKVLSKKLRIGSLFSFFILNFVAIIFLKSSGLLSLSIGNLDEKVLTWICTIFFALNTLGNAVSTSKKEKLIMTPITIIITVAAIIVSINL